MFTESMADFINTDEHAETITYTAYGQSAVYISAIVNEDLPHQEDYERGLQFATAEVTAHESEVANPNTRDIYTFHGYTWHVANEGYQLSNGFIMVNLVRMV